MILNRRKNLIQIRLDICMYVGRPVVVIFVFRIIFRTRPNGSGRAAAAVPASLGARTSAAPARRTGPSAPLNASVCLQSALTGTVPYHFQLNNVGFF